jgi:phosphatidylethanolamine-binding protein (PEBP) family uncharacterized protein
MPGPTWAGRSGFIHWTVYDLPSSSSGLPEAATGNSQALSGGIETPNDFSAASGGTFPGGAAIRGTGYDGPCPPNEHTYVFRLLALDALLALPSGSSPQSCIRTGGHHCRGRLDGPTRHAVVRSLPGHRLHRTRGPRHIRRGETLGMDHEST